VADRTVVGCRCRWCWEGLLSMVKVCLLLLLLALVLMCFLGIGERG
jgi:hypothetical protein